MPAFALDLSPEGGGSWSFVGLLEVVEDAAAGFVEETRAGVDADGGAMISVLNPPFESDTIVVSGVSARRLVTVAT